MIAAESTPNVSVRHAAEICHYYTKRSHTDEIKEILPGSKTLSISCKKFGISKVH